MTNPKHTDTSRSGDLVERLRGGWNGWTTLTEIEAADHIEALTAENERLRAALRDMPEPHEHLGPVDLRVIRSYIDAKRTWRHKHRAALEARHD